MLVVTFVISLVLMNVVTAARLPDSTDSTDHSGDFDTEINPFNAEIPDLNERSNEDEVIGAFANQQQRYRKQHQQSQKSTSILSSTEHTQTKPKARKADLNDDVNEFVELIPKTEIKAKIEEYYHNDMDVQHIFEYMHGKEFLELRKNILELADVKDTIQYLNKNGLNIKSVLRKLDHRLGISKIRSTQLAYSPQMQFGKLIYYTMFFLCVLN